MMHISPLLQVSKFKTETLSKESEMLMKLKRQGIKYSKLAQHALHLPCSGRILKIEDTSY